MTLPLETPFTLIVSGPSSSGKTCWVTHLLNNMDCMIEKPIHRIIWCYAEESSVRPIQNCLKEAQLKKIKFIQGIPENFDNPDDKATLIVIDDLMLDSFNKQICSLFIKGSHHLNMSIILITQNIFHGGKYCRDISLNAKYICIFKSPRDGSQFRYLAQQIFPEGASSLYNVYKKITEERAFSYLFIDLTQKAHHLLRFRTNIFDKDYSIVYCDPAVGQSVHHEEIKGEPSYAIHFQECSPTIT